MQVAVGGGYARGSLDAARLRASRPQCASRVCRHLSVELRGGRGCGGRRSASIKRGRRSQFLESGIQYKELFQVSIGELFASGLYIVFYGPQAGWLPFPIPILGDVPMFGVPTFDQFVVLNVSNLACAGPPLGSRHSEDVHSQGRQRQGHSLTISARSAAHSFTFLAKPLRYWIISRLAPFTTST